jgi:hypothetical protein
MVSEAICKGGPFNGISLPVEPDARGVLLGRWLWGPTEGHAADPNTGNVDDLWPPNEGDPRRREHGGDYRLTMERETGEVSWDWREPPH